MSKPWQPYARHILDAIAKIQRIQARGDLTQVVKSRQTDTRKKLLASIRQEISNKAPAEEPLPENIIREDRSR